MPTISDITLYNPEHLTIGDRKLKAFNKDGITLRQGCKYFRINNINGINGDDLIALSSLDVYPAPVPESGSLNSTMVPPARWFGPPDDPEQALIPNCPTNYPRVAI